MRYALSEIPAGTGAEHHYRITGSHENRPESSEQADCKIQSSTIHFARTFYVENATSNKK